METQSEKKKGNGGSTKYSGAFVDKMVAVEVECEGATPLLINRMTPEVLECIRKGEQPPKAERIGKTRTPREEAEPKVYTLPDGRPYIPTAMLFSSLAAAGQFLRLDGKRQVSTAKSTLLPAFMVIEDPYLVLHLPGEPKEFPIWEVDTRQGRNPHGGSAVCIVRPRFDRWAFTVKIQIDTQEIGEQAIRKLFDMAGRRCGVGDFRPNRKGIYGQFIVKSWTVV